MIFSCSRGVPASGGRAPYMCSWSPIITFINLDKIAHNVKGVGGVRLGRFCQLSGLVIEGLPLTSLKTPNGASCGSPLIFKPVCIVSNANGVPLSSWRWALNLVRPPGLENGGLPQIPLVSNFLLMRRIHGRTPASLGGQFPKSSQISSKRMPAHPGLRS